MRIIDEVRRALQPLMDRGLVHEVHIGTFARYGGVPNPDPPPNPGPHEAITVLVNADNPEAHRVDIMKLVLEAGLKAELHLQPNPSRQGG